MRKTQLGTDQLRVVHLDHTTVRGGAELALARMLAAEPAWTPAVLVPKYDEDNVFDRLPASVIRGTRGVRQGTGGSSNSPIRLLSLGARLVEQAVLTRTDPLVRTCDIVVANSSRAGAYASLALFGSRTPLVVHLRDMIDRESLGALGYFLMTRLILPRADGVIANSRTTLAGALPHIRAGVSAVVIPSAAGLSVADERLPRTTPVRIGMLARIDPWKGQAELLEAFAAAFPDGEEHLELAGGAPFEHEAFAEELRQRAAELGIGDRVHLLGHVEDTKSLLARWDVAVQYSTRAEPLGQNVLQYLAAGITTVVADEGGPVEWVVDGVNGRRVAPRSIPALTEMLRELAGDSEQRERLAIAAGQTPGLLDDAVIADAHADLFTEVLRRRPTPVRAYAGTVDSLETTPISLDVRLEFSRAAIEVVARRGGVRLLHIKGSALDAALRPGRRSGTDIDVMIDPSAIDAMHEQLLWAGWSVYSSFEDGSPFGHAQTYHHAEWGYLDLHRRFPGIRIADREAFELMWADRGVHTTAGVDCAVPSVDAQAVLFVLNAARGDHIVADEVQRLWAGQSIEQQIRRSALVRRMRAEVAFAVPFGDLERHRRRREYLLWKTVSQGGSRTTEWWGRIRAARSLEDAVRTAARAPLVNRATLAHALGHEPSEREVAVAFVHRVRDALQEGFRRLGGRS